MFGRVSTSPEAKEKETKERNIAPPFLSSWDAEMAGESAVIGNGPDLRDHMNH